MSRAVRFMPCRLWLALKINWISTLPSSALSGLARHQGEAASSCHVEYVPGETGTGCS